MNRSFAKIMGQGDVEDPDLFLYYLLTFVRDPNRAILPFFFPREASECCQFLA